MFGPAMINIWFDPFSPSLLPFLSARLRLCYAASSREKSDRLRRATLVPITPRTRAKKFAFLKNLWVFFFFPRMQMAPTPSVAPLAADASCHYRRIKITQGCFYWAKCLLPALLLPSGAQKTRRRARSATAKMRKRAQLEEEVQRKQAAF